MIAAENFARLRLLVRLLVEHIRLRPIWLAYLDDRYLAAQSLRLVRVERTIGITDSRSVGG